MNFNTNLSMSNNLTTEALNKESTNIFNIDNNQKKKIKKKNNIKLLVILINFIILLLRPEIKNIMYIKKDKII